jgi:valyl-tRNA synthetase
MGGGYIPVATTRPETILADTALAIHPDDERYGSCSGKMALVPMLDREIPVITDPYVDMDFGTGALKVTPGHDPNDFEIGKRHGLAVVNGMNKDATMSEAAGPYAGLDRFECRERLWADMESAGQAIKVETYTVSIPRSQRGGEIIEPLVSRQWFVDAEPMAKIALSAVRSGRIEIVPERFVKVWNNWLENIRPWCISRQLWWGHRIPAWHCKCGHITVTTTDPSDCETCGSGDIQQDPDVLDTWFSSALWPYSTLGWPEVTDDLERFYPTDVWETGYDILFFWVARMVMTAGIFTNDIPFHTIYLHGLVRDEHGRKMSKSTGNVVDPLEVMEKYGTDALRFTLLTGGTPGNDLNLSLAKVASNRNFANKIWNVTRFIVQSLENAELGSQSEKKQLHPYSSSDKWILTRLSDVTANANRLYDSYQYGEAGRQIHDFLWGDFADWYLELAKVQLKERQRIIPTLVVLREVFDSCLRMLHPFIPFVTEESWQHIKRAYLDSNMINEPVGSWPEALIVADWPQVGERYPKDAADFERIRTLVRGIRGVRSEHKVEPGRLITAIVTSNDFAEYLESQRAVLSFLARLDEEKLVISETVTVPEDAVTISQGEITAYLPLAGMIDIEQERARLKLESSKLDQQIARVSGLLASEFSIKAPEAVVLREKEKLSQLETSLKMVNQRLSELG